MHVAKSFLTPPRDTASVKEIFIDVVVGWESEQSLFALEPAFVLLLLLFLLLLWFIYLNPTNNGEKSVDHNRTPCHGKAKYAQ